MTSRLLRVRLSTLAARVRIEERPRDDAREDEEQVRHVADVLPGRSCIGPELENRPEDKRLHQRHEERPGHAEERLLVAHADVAPGEHASRPR